MVYTTHVSKKGPLSLFLSLSFLSLSFERGVKNIYIYISKRERKAALFFFGTTLTGKKKKKTKKKTKKKKRWF